MRQKTVRIQDIAILSGVSVATVSRTLSQPERVADSTRDLVMDAVRKTGYRVNHAASNLRKQRSGSILALVPNLANPFFSQILSGLAGVLTPAGYGLLIADTHTDPDPAGRLMTYLKSGLADGVVLFDGSLSVDLMQDRDRPPVLLACEWMAGDMPSVRADNAGGAALAVRYLYRAGHRAIGHVTGPPGNVLTTSRLTGAEDALHDLGLGLRPDWIYEGDFGIASGAEAASRWLSQTDRPTAVFCASDEMACGFIGALQHAGINVPQAVSVIGFDDIELSRYLTPALTTVRQPRQEIGLRAASLLTRMIADRSLVGPSDIIEVELVIRDSVTGPPA